MLGTRIASAVVLIPLVVAVAWLGEPWVSLAVALIVFLALVEVIGLLDAAGFQPPPVFTLGIGMLTAVVGLLGVNESGIGGALGDLIRGLSPPGAGVIGLAAAVVVLGLVSFTRSDPREGFLTWATASFGIAYIAVLAPFLVLVARLAPVGGSPTTAVGVLGLRSGLAWLLLLLLTVWGYDIGAYLTGRWLGRRGLLSHISPSKTVEGLAGGLLLATLGAGLGAALVGLPPWMPLVLGPLLGLAAQAGDLAASMVKRAAGKKESGVLIPGHGGIVDRVDSFLFAGPVLAAFALLAGGATA